ncbi:MAG TPA: phospholipid carrier-dependent glycosyltransferase [Anaerolineales bacterium]|nr:phospholipid carrier-dependent glycosyltransferase [Anaerolineales bacterium]
MKTLRSFALPIAIFIALVVFYRYGLPQAPFEPAEESHLGAGGRLALAIAMLQLPEPYAEPVTQLAVGLGLWAQGYGSGEFDRQPGVLDAARTGPMLLTALTAALLVSFGRRLGGWATGLLAAALFALHPLTLLHGRQALVEPVVAFASTFAILSLLEIGRQVHLAWRRQRDGAVALEAEAAAPAEWDASQMRIETARARERDWLPPAAASLMPPPRAALPDGERRDILPTDAQPLAVRPADPTRRVVMPSGVAGPRWQARQMRIGNARAAEPIPGSTRPGHRLSLMNALRVAWPAALWAGFAFSLTVDEGFLGAALLATGWLALGGILWSRISLGLPRIAAVLALGSVTAIVALGLGLLWRPALPMALAAWRTSIPAVHTIDDLLPALAAPAAQAGTAVRGVFFETPILDATLDPAAVFSYPVSPFTAGWPQPWAGIIGLSLFGLGLAAALRRAQVSGVGALVILGWLAAILMALALSPQPGAMRVSLPLVPPAAVLAAYGLTALIAARGDVRALGR